MTTMYSALVYPLTPEGQGYSRPELPSTFVSQYGISPTWNPYSANVADRTEYWADTAGTLTVEEVEILLIGLTGIQAAQVALVSAGCQAAIFAGFTSSALGEAYTYPSQLQDQLNLNGEITLSQLAASQVAGWTTEFWCADSTGNWDMRAHTAAQIQQVGSDFVATKQANIKQNIVLAGQIMAVTNATPNPVDAVQAIVWAAPSVA